MKWMSFLVTYSGFEKGESEAVSFGSHLEGLNGESGSIGLLELDDGADSFSEIGDFGLNNF